MKKVKTIDGFKEIKQNVLIYNTNETFYIKLKTFCANLTIMCGLISYGSLI